VGTVTFETAEGNVLGLGEQTLTETDITGFKVTSLTVGTKETAWDLAAATVGANGPGWDDTKTTVDAGASNWDEAYGWGDHSEAGYSGSDTTYSVGDGLDLSGTVFSHGDTSSLANLTASGSNVMTGMTYDDYGHAQSHSTGTLTGGTNISVSGLTINGSPNPVVSTVVLSNGFIIDQTSTTVIIRDGVTKLFELDGSGNLTVIGDITAYGTI
jgi:hypothetical protein